VKKTPYESLTDTLALIISGKLSAHPSFMHTPVDELLKICNGCGAADARIDLVPDTIWGLCIRSACEIHDFGYKVGKTIEDKEVEDRRFVNNMVRLIRLYSVWFLKSLRLKRAAVYYLTVRYLGGPAFWRGKIDA